MITKGNALVSGEVAQKTANARSSWFAKTTGAMLISGIMIASVASCGINRAETKENNTFAKKSAPATSQDQNKGAQDMIDNFYTNGMQKR